MRRAAGAAVLASALLLSGAAGAQGIFDLFGPDRPERRAAAPRPARKAEKAEKKRQEPRAAKQGAAREGRKRDGAKSEKAAAGPAAPAAEAPPPPYEPQLARLSEVMGALAFLRDLCGDKDGDDWRGEMAALLDAEAPDGPRREKFVAAFNRGFRSYELAYRTCTPNARTATARYLDEAAKISRDVTYRFGSP